MSGLSGEHWLTDDQRQEFRELAIRGRKDNRRKAEPEKKKRRSKAEAKAEAGKQLGVRG